MGATLSHGVVMIVVVKAKDSFYQNRFPADMFLLLAIKVFGFLHRQADDFLHQCANIKWGAKVTGDPPFSNLHTFY